MSPSSDDSESSSELINSFNSGFLNKLYPYPGYQLFCGIVFGGTFPGVLISVFLSILLIFAEYGSTAV